MSQTHKSATADGSSSTCDSDDDPLTIRALETCGNSWQSTYAALHSSQVASLTGGNKKPRILLFDTSGNGGLADRLTGLMTALLLAILTDRALALDWPGYEAALATPRLNGNAALLSHARTAAAKGEARRIEWLNANRKTLHAQISGAASFDALWPEPVLLVRSNRGFTQGLLRSPQGSHIATAATARGLTPDNGQFGCLFDFLLRPTGAALEPFLPLLEAMRTRRDPSGGRGSDDGGWLSSMWSGGEERPNVTVVGVHIRTGDSAFQQAATAELAEARGKRLFESHKFILEYAEGLAKKLAEAYTPPRVPRLLLLGDSDALRSYAAKEYGERIWMANASVGHIVFSQGAAKQKERNFQSAVAEHWLYSYADAFAYSSHSGFPRTAACRALLSEAIHTCFHYEGPLFNKDQPTARECTGPYSVYQLGERHAAGL